MIDHVVSGSRIWMVIVETETIYSVSQLSTMAGVSIRTLHHYDRIGLLRPNRQRNNGYREYCQEHLVLLQQIIIYRELDFSLDSILDIVTAKDFDLLQALKNQRNLLLERQQNTMSIINRLEVSMNILEGKNNLEILFKGLPTEKVERWNELIVESSGEGGFDETLAALGKLSKEEAETEQNQLDEWLSEYRPLLSQPIDAKPVQACVKEHYILSNRFLGKLFRDSNDFQGIGYNGYLQMAREVLTNQLTNEMYEHYQIGMAEHSHEFKRLG